MSDQRYRVSRRGLLAGLVTVLAAPAALAPIAAEAQAMVRLGTKQVDGRRDSDTIHVDQRGRFRALMLRVRDSPARIHDVVVHFENGQRFRPRVRNTVRRGVRSQVFDLPGRYRDIDRVTFRYSDVGGRRRPDVELFGIR